MNFNSCPSHTHYGNSMNPFMLSLWATATAPEIVEIIENGGFPVFLYQGMSGVAAASALATHMPKECAEKFGMVYVRKTGEKTHGNKLEYINLNNMGNRKPVFIIVDDFISSGKTVLEILKKVSRYFERYISPLDCKYALTWDDMGRLWELQRAIQHSNPAKTTAKIVKDYRTFWDKYTVELEVRNEAMRKYLLGLAKVA